MTDREKAIVMAHTGICMLSGDKFQIFHQYVENILGRPVQTIEMSMESVVDEIKEKSREDFIALCREDQEPCGDCISCEAVMRILDEVGGDFDSPREAVVPIDYIADMVSELPSVTAQPKMGRWIMSDDGLYRPICNNCGAHPWKGYIPTVEEATEAFKYCPNCGCAMQEAKK